MKVLSTIMGLGLLTACQSFRPAQEAPHPFVGCWESESGLSREGWTIDSSGWLVGYSANRNQEGKVTFFEFMRVERGAGPDVLVVSGADGSTTRFTREETVDGAEHRFVNPDHDYPQVITYWPRPGRLDAEISLLDGSQPVEFLKSTCATD